MGIHKDLAQFSNQLASNHATYSETFARARLLARAAYGQHFAATQGGGDGGGGVPINRSLRDAAAAVCARLWYRPWRRLRPSIHGL